MNGTCLTRDGRLDCARGGNARVSAAESATVQQRLLEVPMIRCAPLIVFALAALPCMVRACPIPGDTILQAGFEIRSDTVRYVATSGNDANSGSAQLPWRHLQYAADHVGAGDTVCARGGIYNEVLSISVGGSDAGGAIVFEAYPGAQPILDGTGLPIPGGQWGLITLEDVDRVVVRGFEIRNYSTASTANVPIGVYVTGAGKGIRLLDNHIHDIRTTASGCAANAFGLKVDGTRLSNSISDLVITGNEVDHLVLGCSESLSLDGNVEHWQIIGNTVHDTNNIGIGAIGFEGVAPDPSIDQARDGLIADNTVYHISSFDNPAYGNEYAADGIYVDGGTRIVIERNLVHHVDIGIEVASEHAGRTSSDVIVRSNLVHSGNSAGISIGGYAANVGGSKRVTIVNNTLFDNDRSIPTAANSRSSSTQRRMCSRTTSSVPVTRACSSTPSRAIPRFRRTWIATSISPTRRYRPGSGKVSSTTVSRATSAAVAKTAARYPPTRSSSMS